MNPDLAQQLAETRAAADALAPIVRQLIKDIDEYAALMCDKTPPPLILEREALALYDKLLIQ